MKNLLSIIPIFLLCLVVSCRDDNPVADSTSHSSFDAGNVHYVSNVTSAYLTGFGLVLNIRGDNFELNIILSDTASRIFTITDTLIGSDTGKARCVFKLNNDFRFSTSGSIHYDPITKSGTFSVVAEDLSLLNGVIKTDTVLNQGIVDFKNLSETDVNGWPMNTPDATDWGIRASWDAFERLVFNLKETATPAGSIQLIEYPNPLAGILSLQLAIPAGSTADLLLVNQNYELEQKFVGLAPGVYVMQLNNPAYTGNYYRLCYKINSGTVQLYGTGDLKIVS